VALGLDLAESRAKLDRAADHLRALDSQMPVIRDHDPITIRISDIDPDTGWCDVFARWNQIEEPSLSVIAGDYVHNLRSALDYVVTALVQASNAQLRESHQFPIFTSRVAYSKAAGTASKAKSGGPLRDIKHGLGLIERFQPYHQKPNPHSHPLAHINRLSNTDKHRQTLMLMALPAEGKNPSLMFEFGGGTCVEIWQSPTFTLSVYDEAKIAALRFAEPHPPEVGMNGTLTLQPMLGAPSFPPKYPEGLLVSMEIMKELHECTAALVGQAEAL
jgi:hypothetical protein